MATKHYILLVPGFFGFANLGELLYFGHVRDYFVAEMAARGVDVEVVQVLTHPTGSIRTRAGDLLKLTGLIVERDGAWLALDEAEAPVRFGEVIAWDVAAACDRLANEFRMPSSAPRRAASVR